MERFVRVFGLLEDRLQILKQLAIRADEVD